MLTPSKHSSAIFLTILLIGCSAPATPVPARTSASPSTNAPVGATAAPSSSAPGRPTRSTAPPAPTLANAQTAPANIKGDAANGEKLFSQKKIECDSCHDVTQPYPGGDNGPNLGNIATVANAVIKSPDYTGKAKTTAEYLRESILNPNIYIVPGDEYREKDGTSGMTQGFAQTLTPQQVEDLIAYLLTLK